MDPCPRSARSLGVAVLAVTLLAAGPLRADQTLDRLAPAIGATIVSTHPDGRKARLWLHRDGTYAAEGRAGNRSSGSWKVRGEKLCLHQHSPFPFPISYCKPVPAESLNTPWRDKAVNGDQVTNEIVPGSE